MNGDYDPIEPVSTLPPRRPWLRKAALPAITFLLGLGALISSSVLLTQQIIRVVKERKARAGLVASGLPANQ